MAPLSLAAYRVATRVMGPLAGPILAARAKRGKEDPARLPERFGHTSAPRPAERMAWLHGASVGESLMLASLLTALLEDAPDWGAVMTTNTTTSAELLAKRLPGLGRALHQYAPIDRPDVAARFLDHWRPELAVFAESELWPNLILAAKARGTRLALVNARMTEKSLRGWARAPAAARAILGAFDWIGAADARTAEGLAKLCGREVACVGNLKEAAEPPVADPETLARLQALLGDRPVWLAASTHPGEDEIVLDAHQRLRAHGADWLLILAPRHPARGPDIHALAEARGLTAARRAAGVEPGAEHSVYIADTLGEMGLWYRLARAALIAGSLVPDIGGHNPLEPALLGAPMLTGPFTHNFEALYAELVEEGGAALARDAADIACDIAALDETLRAGRASAARTVAARGGTVLEDTLKGLRPLMREAANARA